jgi:hypothetical protein
MLTTAPAIAAAPSIIEGVTPEAAISAARGRKIHRIVPSTNIFVAIRFGSPSFLPYSVEVGEEFDDFF